MLIGIERGRRCLYIAAGLKQDRSALLPKLTEGAVEALKPWQEHQYPVG